MELGYKDPLAKPQCERYGCDRVVDLKKDNYVRKPTDNLVGWHKLPIYLCPIHAQGYRKPTPKKTLLARLISELFKPWPN